MGLQELNQKIMGIRKETDERPSLLRISEATMQKLVERGGYTVFAGPVGVKSSRCASMLLGIPVLQVPEMPIGEMRLVTSRGVEAMIVNISTN